MSAAENKQRLQVIFAELAKSNSGPFVDCLADDVSWTIAGKSKWSKSFRGKQEVLTGLLAPVASMFADPFTLTAHRIIADDDVVMVEARGHGTTKAGKSYDNSYCLVFRMAGGKLKEVTEYMDTELATTMLG
jgi:ketosteroid isomerase-like protein